ncbi:UNVERIFIED_CONTAM: 26S proteasome non-ATPase regulatory subunitA [Sesamum angustifolium]|uniref:26S proteasome non-ATPase regulatory subunitA n=1 Tax=Sesamum angustifolium TaxID=2727405 RepID=A0AAW2LCK8_9LAMI
MDVIKSKQISSRPIEKVVVHPLVLLSIVDHYNRVARDTRKRVVGVLLELPLRVPLTLPTVTPFERSLYQIIYGVTLQFRVKSFSLPFEEDDKDPSIWFLDHNYHEAMFSMFRRINAKEHVVGWYSTGPKLRENDLNIHGLFNDYVPTPVLVIIDVTPKELGIPTKAYYAVEEVKEVTGKLAALKGLDARLKEIRSYLDLVIEGKLPLNHEILYHLQDVFNLLPNLNVSELVKAFAVKTNDMMLVIYLSSLIRSVIALHNLINNKMLNKEHEKAEDSKPVAVPTAAGS